MSRTQLFRLSTALTLLAVLVLAPVASAQAPIDVRGQGASVHQPAMGATLTGPSDAAPRDVVTGFLAGKGHSDAARGSLVTTVESRDDAGNTFLRLKQEVAGLEVFGTYVKATVAADGALVHMIENIATPPGQGVAPALVSPREPLAAALDRLHPGLAGELVEVTSHGNTVVFDAGAGFYQDPTVTRVAIPMSNGAMEEGFLVETWISDDNLLHHTLVDRRGRVIDTQLRTALDSYNVYQVAPDVSSQQIAQGPGAGNVESPAGWLFSGDHLTFDIAGNNVNAYLDTNASNSADPGGTVVSDGNFTTSANLSQEPETNQNKEVAVQNLFYFNNVVHDKLYRHGFVESAGNFQEDNFGNGGAGGDSVNAEAQDGSGTNNANFSTPSDGSNPRMQMFVWTQTSPKRDGDLESDIIYHEYGHGLTWRMIGNMSGPMSGAIGEGMSDVLAILINNNDVVGEYSTNDPFGIRSESYTNYSRTYGDFGGSSVHFDGEIYAATMWRAWEIFQANGVSQDTLFDYIVGGMNFTPSGPAYEDMRDGILQAASGSGHECLIWDAFAQFGIGEGASGSVKGGGPFGGGSVTVNESFAVPAACDGGACTPTEDPEVSCSDGLDNDCDGLADGNDPDCDGGSCLASGSSCSANSECCSGNCKGKSGSQTCK